jgi:serine/arginine repetitive matrix protein 2
MADIDSTLNPLNIGKATINIIDDAGENLVPQGDVQGREAEARSTHETSDSNPNSGNSETNEALASASTDALLSPSTPTTASTPEITPATTTTNTSTIAPAPLKRFSSVNINRRFLEKTSNISSSGTNNSTSSQNTSKLTTTTSKPLWVKVSVLTIDAY